MGLETSIATVKPISVGMGQMAIAKRPGTITSVLGSCVGIALFHPRTAIGAFAHVVMPSTAGKQSHPARHADTAVPHLLQALAEQGATTFGMVARIAGGASMFGSGGPLQIGEANIAAVRAALAAVRIPIVGQDLGGVKGRRVTFDLTTGAMTVEAVGEAARTI